MRRAPSDWVTASTGGPGPVPEPGYLLNVASVASVWVGSGQIKELRRYILFIVLFRILNRSFTKF